MTLIASTLTDNPLFTPITPVFGDNVQDLLNAGSLKVKPTGIIVVNSIDDTLNTSPGVITLRDAIKKANADPGEDLIVFDRPLFSKQQSITLKLGELDITHNLDIIAPTDELTGGDLVAVSGNKASRVFEIEKGVTANLSGLIVADGLVTGSNGGGIKNSGTLTLDSSIVRGGDAGNGGGIYNSSSAMLTVSNSIITQNKTTTGGSGGIIEPGIDGGDAGNGGGIFNDGRGTVKVSNTTLSGNSALNEGGGIVNNGGNVEVSNSTLSDNSSGYGGGGIYSGNRSIPGSTLTVSNSTITNNSANNQGGGIFIYYGAGDVSNSTISGNSAVFYGGGISIYLNSTIDVSKSTISHNSAYAGGGIDNSGILTVSNSTISDNSALLSTVLAEGGGIRSTGTMTVSNSTISGNSAVRSGGGLYYGRGVVSNSNISGNSAGGSGGGIYGGGTISNSTISNNSAANNGGGIFFGGGTISNSTISNNSAGLDGGGILNSNGSETQLTNTTISNNSAGRNGGGIYHTIYLAGSPKGVMVLKGSVNAINSTLSGNIAGNQGGGIYNSGGVLNLLFSTFTLNQAANGGGIYTGTSFLGGVTTPDSAVVRNTIIAGNLPIPDGINPDVSGNFTSRGYNLIGDSTGSTGFDPALGDIVGTSDWPIDPRLAPLDFNGGPTQTIALLPDSPAIGVADPTILDTDPTTDQRGLARRASDCTADIGAFQFS